jgi:hypothetical protein
VTLNLRHVLYASSLLALSTSVCAQSATLGYSSSNAEIATAELPDAPSTLLQQAGAAQQAPPANETPEQRKAREAEGQAEVKKQEKQRVGGVLPLFNVVISGKTVPLTPAQKFDLSYHTIIDPYTIGLAVVVGGGFGELEDSHQGYHHGPEGLFKRIGASYADNAIGNVIGNAVLPTLLHQDPRYYRKGEGSIVSRVVYSALTTFISYGDNGKKQFNTSNIVGNVIAGGISNAYYPSDERGLVLTLQNAATVTYEGMLGAQILEFSPDLQNYVHKRREHHRMVLQQQADAAAAAKNGSAPSAPPAPPPHTAPDPKPQL